MLQKLALPVILAFALIMTLFVPSNGALKLYGTAEDQWGNKIDLSRHDNGIVVIHPLSTSH